MTIQNILAILTGTDHDSGVATTAFLAAERFGAHVAGLHVRADIFDDLPFFEEHLSQFAIARAYGAATERRDRTEALAKQYFEIAREAAGADYTVAPTEADNVSASWQVEVEDLRVVAGQYMWEIAGRRGRVFDLTAISSQVRATGASGRDMVDSTVFGTGRPVLVSPAQPPVSLGDRILVAWNGSTQSARAVGDAMPFLKLASQITVAYVDIGIKAGPSPEDLRANLTWHGVDAAVKRIEANGISVAELIGNAASEEGADLLVIGAYSHSRFKEIVLGGVTRHFLDHTDLPVLMAH